MNVQPTLPTHTKFTMLRNVAGDRAMEYLVRLWAHCQTMQRGENWGRMELKHMAEYVEAVCDWRGEAGKLFEALNRKFCGKPGWVTVTKKGALIVTQWEQHNAALLRSWSGGETGGRPRKNEATPETTRKVSGRQPSDNLKVKRKVSGRQPSDNLAPPPIGVDLIGVDLIGVDLIGVDGSGDPDARANLPVGHYPEAEIPGLAEVLAFCDGPAGIPKETGRKFFEHYEKTAAPPWTDGAGRRFQWRGKLTAWAARDRGGGPAFAPGGASARQAGEDKAQLLAELGTETDPEKRSALRKKLEQVV